MVLYPSFPWSILWNEANDEEGEGAGVPIAVL